MLLLQPHQGFDLQKLFDSWSGQPTGREDRKCGKKSKEFNPLFFGNKELYDFFFKKPAGPLKNYPDPVWLYIWDVQFEDLNHRHLLELNLEEKDKKKSMRDLSAVDKGGPTRAFLSEVWRQLGSLKARGCGDDMSRTLFETQSSGELWPQSNERLMIVGKSSVKDEGTNKEEFEKAKVAVEPLGRALGRIMLHSIANRFEDPKAEDEEMPEKFTIAGHVLPPPYRRYLLQGIKPTDHRYELRDLLQDFLNLHFSEKSETKYDPEHILSHLDFYFSAHEVEEGTLGEKLRKATEIDWIDKRSIVLESLKEGLGMFGS